MRKIAEKTVRVLLRTRHTAAIRWNKEGTKLAGIARSGIVAGKTVTLALHTFPT